MDGLDSELELFADWSTFNVTEKVCYYQLSGFFEWAFLSFFAFATGSEPNGYVK